MTYLYSYLLLVVPSTARTPKSSSASNSKAKVGAKAKTKQKTPPTMAANIQPGKGRNATKYNGPPKNGYAARYEQLLMDELSLENSRKNYLKSSAATATVTLPNGNGVTTARSDEEQLSTLKIRGLIHRASLEGMLLGAQHAADEAKSNLNNAVSIEYEQGLERPESKDALAALWTMKSRQLENDDNQIPLPLGSESLAWRRKFLSGIPEWMDVNNGSMNGSSKLEANVDDFFCAFGECRRRDHAVACDSDVDVSSDSDGYERNDNRKPQSKRKKTKDVIEINDEPIVVTCASSSPSPERPVESSVNVSKPPSRDNVQSHNRSPPNAFDQQSTGQPQHHQNGNVNGVAIQAAPQPMQRPSSSDGTLNPYQRKQQTQWKNDQHQQPIRHQNEPSAFDYDDNNSYHNTDDTFDSMAKKNPFCTARELGPNFKDTSSRGGNKRGDHGDNDWDSYGRNDNGYPDNNNHRRMGGGGVGSNNRSKSCGPQQMVRTAIRGPRKDISAGLQRKFQPPMKRENGGGQASGNANNSSSSNSNSTSRQAYGGGNIGSGKDDDELPEELRGLDKELIEKINNEIVDSGEQVTFDDIAGLKHAKETVNELVIMPMIRPDLFTGLRACPKGLLLFGPPGTGTYGYDLSIDNDLLSTLATDILSSFVIRHQNAGKTLIGKAIAHESRATFFSISSSSLTSKWIGEGEKLVRTLFALASYRAPSVVFIDEVDSLLTQRKADENEASRRIKTEFLVQLDGAGNGRKGQVLVIGATNLPQELDDAARRRFVKKLYIPLPDQEARESLLTNLLKKNDNTLSDAQITKLALATDGFSGADLKNLCADAAMGPLREFGAKALEINTSDLPPISYNHFRKALRKMNPSVAQSDLDCHIEWNNKYGSTIGHGGDDSSQDSDAGSVGESSLK